MLLRHIHGTSPERSEWRKFGIWISVGSMGVAFAQWLTVRAHPEQDLPLWPAWVFAGVAALCLTIVVGSFMDRNRS